MQYASLPTSQLAAWATLNNVALHGVKVEHDIVEHGNNKGGGIIATANHDEGDILLVVPQDIVVSKQQIADCARADARLRELLDALAESDLTRVRCLTLPTLCHFHSR